MNNLTDLLTHCPANQAANSLQTQPREKAEERGNEWKWRDI